MEITCRTCFGKYPKPRMVPIFGELYKNLYDLGEYLIQMLYIKVTEFQITCSHSARANYTNLSFFQIEFDGSFEQVICLSCAEKIVEFREFTDMVIATDQKLRATLATGGNISDTLPLESVVDRPRIEEIMVASVEDDVNQHENIDNCVEINFENVVLKNEITDIKADTDSDSEPEPEFKPEKEKKHFCTICNKQYKNRASYRNHIRKVHEERKPEPPIECDICLAMSKNKGALATHKNRMHPNWRELQPAVNSRNWKKHCEQNKTPKWIWKCCSCDLTFRTRGLYQVHGRYTGHKGNRQKEFQCSDDELYICDYCEKVFTDRQKILKHFRTHLEKKCLCMECGSMLSSPNILKMHIQHVHRGVKRSKLAECTICHQRFTTKSDLRDHVNRHNNIRPNKCEFCPAAFVTLSSLHTHIEQLHIKSKKHVCSICSKSFAVKGNLTAHMFIHLDYRPHPCPSCDQGFYRKKKMLEHAAKCRGKTITEP